MASTIRDVMTAEPITLPTTATLVEAARTMRDDDIGNVVVVEGETAVGIVTDRDVVIRAIAEERDPASTTLSEIATEELVTVTPEVDVAEAVRLMRDNSVRRILVLEDDRPIGLVSIGDLAIERDPDSALADISSAPPTE